MSMSEETQEKKWFRDTRITKIYPAQVTGYENWKLGVAVHNQQAVQQGSLWAAHLVWEYGSEVLTAYKYLVVV